MNKQIYKHKKTGQRVVTSEKLDKRQWTKVGVIKSGQMNPNKIWQGNIQTKRK